MLRATIVAAACAASMAAHAQQRPIAADALRSGITYAGADIRAMQADDLANPGFLWVQRGEALFNENCTACHRDAASMRGVAARYPAYDPPAKSVLDLEGRIEQCRTERQHKPAFGRESDDLVALATFVTHQSRGLPMSVSIDGPARSERQRGRAGSGHDDGRQRRDRAPTKRWHPRPTVPPAGAERAAPRSPSAGIMPGSRRRTTRRWARRSICSAFGGGWRGAACDGCLRAPRGGRSRCVWAWRRSR